MDKHPPPSFRAWLSIAAYWAGWLLVLFSVFSGRFRSSGTALLCLLIATALAAWFTWVRLKDDARQQLLGIESDDDDPDQEASPARRFVMAVFLGLGGLGCLFASALLRPMRTQLVVIGLLVLVAAFYVLFFGKRSRRSDTVIDLDFD